MLNNICVTDCIYCYQDKRNTHTCEIPLDRIIELIHEAKKLHVNTFDIIGGEFLLYKDWYTILKTLHENGFNPFLSTKIPLAKETIKQLAELSILDIQVSLDSLISPHIVSSLKVNESYVTRIKQSLIDLSDNNIPVIIHTVLTCHNDSIEDMKSIFEFLKTLKNISHWKIVKGEPSLYPKVPYEQIEIRAEQMNLIIDYLTSINQESDIKILFPERVSISNTLEQSSINEQESNSFFSRAYCSGLFSSLYILPDGKVTICEQLYWNPHFIIGDVRKQNIEEIWNSNKAKSLYFIKQEDIPSDSSCHDCNIFDKCRNIRQVCYREIVRKYGPNKWYYPDPNCPLCQQHG